jgi:transposase
MSMVCGLDLHRQQITFDAVETASGEVWRGRVWQPDREPFRRWLCRDVARRANGQPVVMAVEGCTGWRYVVEEITAAGFEAHLAEPADTQTARGRKRHAKTDRSDARLLRELLQSGELPESWIPPTAVLEWRARRRHSPLRPAPRTVAPRPPARPRADNRSPWFAVGWSARSRGPDGAG